MGAADADYIIVLPGHRAKQEGALDRRDAERLCGDQLGVVVVYGRRVDDQIGALDAFGLVPHGDRDAERADTLQRVAFVVVRPGDFIPLAVQNLGQRAHTRAADADHVNFMCLLDQKIGFRLLLHNTRSILSFPLGAVRPLPRPAEKSIPKNRRPKRPGLQGMPPIVGEDKNVRPIFAF